VGGAAATNVTVVNTERITRRQACIPRHRRRGGAESGRHLRNAVQAFSYRDTHLDFTGDLKSDILWRHATQGDLWLWPMDGATRTAETYVRAVPDTNWEIRGLGDQTGDGKGRPPVAQQGQR